MTTTAARELGPYAGFDHRFVVRCQQPALAAHLEAALATLACSAGTREVDTHYELVGDDDRLAVLADGEELAASASAGRAIGVLAWHVNRCAVQSVAHDHVVVHAAAVARRGRALLLPAVMEAGKTTLAAGLIDRGWSYLSDEAAAVAPDGTTVRAYPKPLSIDPGSQQVLAHWRPAPVDGAPASLQQGQWQVPATARPGGRVVPAAELAAVVLPRYHAGAATVLTRVSRASALARVAECTFAWHGARLPQRFAALAAAVRHSDCAELVTGDLDEACAAVERFWTTVP